MNITNYGSIPKGIERSYSTSTGTDLLGRKHPKRDWKTPVRYFALSPSLSWKHPKRDWKYNLSTNSSICILPLLKHPKRDWKIKGIKLAEKEIKLEASQKGLKDFCRYCYHSIDTSVKHPKRDWKSSSLAIALSTPPFRKHPKRDWKFKVPGGDVVIRGRVEASQKGLKGFFIIVPFY